MELSTLIDALSQPQAYPHPAGAVEVVHTHASVVFLVEGFAYKVKKPVDFGFLDYSTLAKRKRMCELEVEFNTRLAPDVYLGVVPIVRDGAGVCVGAAGEPVEYAVRMKRLPDEARLGERLARGEVEPRTLESLARRLAEFHRVARQGPDVAEMASFEVVERNCLENFEQLRSAVGTVVSEDVLERLEALTRAELARCRTLIDGRAAGARESHGDLRLEHVYLFPDETSPADLAVVDCIEFNERFRFGDPIADIAFLVMDMKAHGFSEAADRFARAYIQASGDHEGAQLLPLYTAYRATVRGKVRGMQAAEAEVPTEDRERALEVARGHMLQALSELARPEQRPCLLITCGLPGTGKSVLAHGLADVANFEVVRSDVTRKRLAGLDAQQRATNAPEGGIYDKSWTERTYRVCLDEAEALLFQGRRVIVDATFRNESQRLMFLEAARRLGVPFRILHCVAPAPMVKDRLDTRQGDASDADWGVYLHMETIWDPFSPQTAAAVEVVDTRGTPTEVARRGREALRGSRLASPGPGPGSALAEPGSRTRPLPRR